MGSVGRRRTITFENNDTIEVKGIDMKEIRTVELDVKAIGYRFAKLVVWKLVSRGVVNKLWGVKVWRFKILVGWA